MSDNNTIQMLRAVVENAGGLEPQHRRAILQAISGSPAKGRQITAREAVEILGITRVTLFAWAKAGRVTPIRRSPRSIRYDLSEIQRLASEGDAQLCHSRKEA